MKEFDIEKLIAQEFEKETPDLKARILDKCDREEQLNPASLKREASVTGTRSAGRSFPKITRLAAMAAMFVLVFTVGILLGNFVMPNTVDGTQAPSTPPPAAVVSEVANVYLDVNPSIELVIEENGYVKNCIGANDDAKKILSGLKLEGVEVQTAINAIIGSMYMSGYITADSNSILVSAKSNSDKFAGLLDEIVNNVNAVMSKTGFSCSIIARNVEDDESTAAMAGQNNVSFGKMSLVKKIVERIDGYSDEDIPFLTGMSIKELNLIYTESPEIFREDNKTDDEHDHPYDYEYDEDDIEDEIKDIVSGKLNDYIEKDDAVDAIVEAIGVSRDSLGKVRVFVKPARGDDGHRMVFSVSFTYNGVEYNYEVDCQTSEVVLISENSVNPQPQPPQHGGEDDFYGESDDSSGNPDYPHGTPDDHQGSNQPSMPDGEHNKK